MNEGQAEDCAAEGGQAMRRLSLWPVALVVALLAAVAAYVVPRGIEARRMLEGRLAHHAVYIREYGEDMPAIREWRWPATPGR